MTRYSLPFFVAIVLFILVVLAVLDYVAIAYQAPRPAAAIVVSNWAAQINKAALKFYQDHIEIKE